MKRLLFSIGLIMLNGLGAVAQYTYVKHYNQSNGLPQNTVNALFFDTNFKLWALTEDGISVFNGNAFTLINSSTTGIIKSNRFRWAIPYQSNKVVIGNTDGSLYFINQNGLQVLDTANSSYTYLAGKAASLSQLKLATNLTQLSQKLPLKIHPNYIFHTNHNYSLGQTYLYKHNGKEVLDSMALLAGVKSMIVLNDVPYVFVEHGIYSVDIHNKTIHSVSVPKFENQFRQVKWFPDANGKFLYALMNQKVHVYTIKKSKLIELNSFALNGFVKGYVTSIAYQSLLKTLAVGTSQNGFYIFYPSSFRVSTKDNFDDNQTAYYAHDRLNDSTVITTDGMQFTFEAVTKSKHYSFDQSTSNSALKIDANRVVWKSTTHYLALQKPGEVEKKIHPLFFEKVGAFLPYGDSMFVVFKNKVLVFVNYQLKDSIQLPYLSATQDREISIGAYLTKNELLVSNYSGVYSLPLSNLHQIKLKAKLSNVNFIGGYNDLVFYIEKNKRVWIEHASKLKALNTDPLQFLVNPHSIAVVDHQTVIITTNRGLLTTSYAQLINYINTGNVNVSYNYFTAANGLPNAEFNSGGHTLNTGFKNGWVTLSNMAGIIWFNPQLLSQGCLNTFYPYVNSIQCNGIFVKYSDTLIISDSIYRTVIDLESTYWGNVNDVSYSYKLGVDQWVRLPKSNQSIVFTNLESGWYTLDILAETGGVRPIQKHIRVTIYKSPHYYETIWFKVLMVLFILLTSITLAWWYTQRLRNRNVELESKVKARTQKLENVNKDLEQNIKIKNKLITIISHDIATPLRFISRVLSKLLHSSSPNEQQEIMFEVKSTIERLNNHTQNLLNWMRYQSEMIKPNLVLVAPLVIAEHIAELYVETASVNRNTITVDVSEDAIMETDGNMLSILLQNLVANAVNHNTDCTIVIYSTETSEGHLVLGVKDTGKGIRFEVLRRLVALKNKAIQTESLQNAESTSLGYLVVFDLALTLNVDIRILTSSNGTDVRLVVKTNK